MIFYFTWLIISIILLSLYKNNRKINIEIIIIFLLCTLVYGCRDIGGIDDITYMKAFEMARYNDNTFGLEGSYIYISKFLSFIGFNYKSIFLLYAVTAFIFMYLAYKKICKQESDWVIGILGFFTFIFIPTITLMRQFTALCIVTYSTICFTEKKYAKSIFLILLSSLVHESALFILLFLPIFKIKFNNYVKILLPIISFILGYTGIFNLIIYNISYLIPNEYKNYIINDLKFEIGILHWLLISIYISQFLLSIIKKSQAESEKKNDLLENGQMIYFSTYFLTLSSGWLNRISLYFILFIPFIFKTFIDRFKLKNERKILYIICYMAYIVLFIYQILNADSSQTLRNLIPYKGSLDFMS